EHRMPDLPVKTPEQLVTLASIVEKETGRPDERTRVAAVFVNRLKTKMRLQSDPTIIYGLTGGKGSLGRPIQKGEIEQPTPYNTYVIDGLPPGPIANPGRASLEAAANPARTKEIYFVADGSGGHLFSDNYTEHQKNVARLRGLEHANGNQNGRQ
ncbi:MAG: endolytic transglycosylase MltG, partial [Pseudolabrys sp.]